ncbi:MAG TPA: hypothetical protein PKD12_22340 [Nitrospira sp.]|nr:hypothetical protein [Nitrospira sp.]
MRESRHHSTTVPPMAIVFAYLILLGQAALLLCSDETAIWLGMEDGPIENIGALSFLLASVLFFMTAYRSSRLQGRSRANHFDNPLTLLLLGAFCFICFGEEISWGQRVFAYPVPDWLKDFNRQDEWNLHNLAWFHGQTAGGTEKSFWARLLVMDRLLAVFQLALCTLVPVLTGYSTVLRTWAARIGLPIVPWWIAGLVPFHIFTTQVLYAIMGENIIVGDALDETKESMRAAIFLLVAIWAYRLTSTVSFVPRVLGLSDPSEEFKATP